MAYCTQDDLLRLIPEGELAELTTEAGEVPDEAVVAQAIAAADAEIDSYLAVRYQLPLTGTPARVKALSVDITVYRLYTRRGISPPSRRENYEDAVKFLKDVAGGRAEIVGLAGVEAPGAASEVVEIKSSERVFSRDKLGDW